MDTSFIPTHKIYSLLSSNPEVTTDSRNVSRGALFFALRGEQFNGNRYATGALEAGAAFAIVDDPEVCLDQRYLLVSNVLNTLQELAKMHRKKLNATVLAITGSNGKTTTKELIHAVLSRKYRSIATKGNLNNHIGVPLTILRTPPDAEMLIVEMGANHIGEIKELCRIADPEYGIITNIGHAHLEGFGSYEGVVRAKGELYDYLSMKAESMVFLNADDPKLCSLANARSLNSFLYGSKQADIRGFIDSDQLLLNLKWEQDTTSTNIQTNLAGAYNLSNVLAAIAVGSFFGVPDVQIREALEAYMPANNRSQVIETGNNRVIADCYNANPSSMTEAIRTFMSLGKQEGMMILGDMLELGEYSEEEHRRMARMASETLTQLVFVGEQFFSLRQEISGAFFKKVDQLISWIQLNKPTGMNILVKGSRGIHLERVLPYL
jgi:UDP-N-acetylmuramoyl-tripeptide--D-alanyl-D-alanine ligase